MGAPTKPCNLLTHAAFNTACQTWCGDAARHYTTITLCVVGARRLHCTLICLVLACLYIGRTMCKACTWQHSGRHQHTMVVNIVSSIFCASKRNVTSWVIAEYCCTHPHTHSCSPCYIASAQTADLDCIQLDRLQLSKFELSCFVSVAHLGQEHARTGLLTHCCVAPPAAYAQAQLT